MTNVFNKIKPPRTFGISSLPDMKKSEKEPKKAKESVVQDAPISLRPPPESKSKIRKYLKEIQEIDPNESIHGILNECLERYLPELLEEKKEALRERYKKIFGQEKA